MEGVCVASTIFGEMGGVLVVGVRTGISIMGGWRPAAGAGIAELNAREPDFRLSPDCGVAGKAEVKVAASSSYTLLFVSSARHHSVPSHILLSSPFFPFPPPSLTSSAPSPAHEPRYPQTSRTVGYPVECELLQGSKHQLVTPVTHLLTHPPYPRLQAIEGGNDSRLDEIELGATEKPSCSCPEG